MSLQQSLEGAEEKTLPNQVFENEIEASEKELESLFEKQKEIQASYAQFEETKSSLAMKINVKDVETRVTPHLNS